MTFTQLEDARNELAAALRYGVITDDFAREHVVNAHRILQQQCRLEHGATIPLAASFTSAERAS